MVKYDRVYNVFTCKDNIRNVKDKKEHVMVE